MKNNNKKYSQFVIEHDGSYAAIYNAMKQEMRNGTITTMHNKYTSYCLQACQYNMENNNTLSNEDIFELLRYVTANFNSFLNYSTSGKQILAPELAYDTFGVYLRKQIIVNYYTNRNNKSINIFIDTQNHINKYGIIYGKIPAGLYTLWVEQIIIPTNITILTMEPNILHHLSANQSLKLRKMLVQKNMNVDKYIGCMDMAFPESIDHNRNNFYKDLPVEYQLGVLI